MGARRSALFGLAAVAVLYLFIMAAIMLSPWFSWWDNALSDLGNVSTSPVAVVFNVGLLIAGFLTVVYAVAGLRHYAPCSSWFLAVTGLSLQLVGGLNEAYGYLHFLVSAFLFLLLLASSLAYFAEKRSFLALLAPLGIIPWVLFFEHLVFPGAALPEIISSLVVVPWVISSAVISYKKGGGDDPS